ncbi:copper resistance CopC family protein [Janibacter anophelis]
MTTLLPAPAHLIGHDGQVTTTQPVLAPFARLVTAILALAALLAALVVTAPPASAHARLEASSPKDGSTLTATPPEIMLRFNEEVQDGLNQVSVKSGSTDVTDGDLEIDGNTVYQPIKARLDAGDYTVSYKVVSADGHPISGTLNFTYAPPEGDDGAGTPSTSATASEGSTSDAPTASGSATPPPASSTQPSSPTTSAPSSTSAPESSSTSAPESTSSSTSPTDGETEPTPPEDATSSTSDEPVAGDETSTDEGGIPAWVWIAAIGALLVILAGAGLLARNRRDGGDDEDIDLEEWRG